MSSHSDVPALGRFRSGTVAKVSKHDISNIRRSVFENEISVQGYLEKLSSGMMKRWQSRYFELAGLYVKYFERAFPRTPDHVRGVIYLDQLRVCAVDAENVIHLVFDGSEKPMQLRARSAENAQRWAEEIRLNAGLTGDETADGDVALAALSVDEADTAAG
eukprot:g5555.t1